MSAIGQEVSPSEAEPGRRYRFTLRRPLSPKTRTRTVEGVLGAAFWGEVPLQVGRKTVRVERADVVRIVEVL